MIRLPSAAQFRRTPANHACVMDALGSRASCRWQFNNIAGCKYLEGTFALGRGGVTNVNEFASDVGQRQRCQSSNLTK